MSQLSQIQDEILRRFRRPQPMDERLPQGTMPGRGEVGPVRLGGDMPVSQSTAVSLGGGQPAAQSSAVPLGGQRSVFAPPQQQGRDQTLTPTNREAVTRPRSVFAPPPQTEAPEQPTFDGKSILAPKVGDEPFGSRDRRTQPRDYVADDTQYLRDLNAQPRNWKDKTVDALRVANSVWGSNPKAFTPTKREREIGETEDRLGTGLKTAHTQAQIAASQAQTANAGMVPVQTNDGRTIMIPRAKVGDWETKQRTANLNEDKFKASGKKPVYKTDAQGRIIKITPQPDGEDKVETVSKVVKTKVPHTVWADGKLKLWNPESGQFDDAKDTNDQEITDTIRTAVTVEIAGKTFKVSPNTAAMATATGERFNITEDRAERGEARRDTSDAQGRTAKAAELAGEITRAREAMATAKTKLSKDPGDTDAKDAFESARSFGNAKAKELNDGYGDLYKAGEGSEGTPYAEPMKGSAQPSGGGQGGVFNMKGWIADHPDATTAEKRAIRAKAKARQMTISE